MLKKILFLSTALLTFNPLTLHAAGPHKKAPQPKYHLNESKVALGEHLFEQIRSDPTDVKMLKNIYGERIMPENILDAMNQFIQWLASPSPFDEYLKGNKNALTPEEKQGYALFKSYGCAACHNGPKLGGSQFRKMGTARNFFLERKTLVTPADLGLYEVTKNTQDVNVFKVPGLRNVALFAPYYHDGSVKSLTEAVYLMGKYQVGVTIPDKDIKAIVAFLHALTAIPLKKTSPMTSDPWLSPNGT